MAQKFSKASLGHFLSMPDSGFACCPTTDCGGIFPKFSGAREMVFHCLECKNDICTRLVLAYPVSASLKKTTYCSSCCAVFHAGYSCENFQMLKENNESLKVML